MLVRYEEIDCTANIGKNSIVCLEDLALTGPFIADVVASFCGKIHLGGQGRLGRAPAPLAMQVPNGRVLLR